MLSSASMLSASYVLTILVVIGAITLLLRWIPFAFVRTLRNSAFFSFLSRTMPVGVMVALVVYALFARMNLLGDSGSDNADPGGWWAAPVALAVTVGLHLWRRNSLLSIFAGTALYMVLVNFLA